MLTVFSYQVLRLLRDRILLVWTLGFPIVLSLIFMAQFSNLNEAYEANPMSFGVVQDGAYRADPGLDAVVERISADDADPHLITKVTHSTASEAEAAASPAEDGAREAVAPDADAATADDEEPDAPSSGEAGPDAAPEEPEPAEPVAPEPVPSSLVEESTSEAAPRVRPISPREIVRAANAAARTRAEAASAVVDV